VKFGHTPGRENKFGLDLPSAKSVFDVSKNDSSCSSGVRGVIIVYGCDFDLNGNNVVWRAEC